MMRNQFFQSCLVMRMLRMNNITERTLFPLVALLSLMLPNINYCTLHLTALSVICYFYIFRLFSDDRFSYTQGFCYGGLGPVWSNNWKESLCTCVGWQLNLLCSIITVLHLIIFVIIDHNNYTEWLNLLFFIVNFFIITSCLLIYGQQKNK